MKLEINTVRDTFHRALRTHGMDEAQAASTANVFLDAELAGKSSHGAFHLLTYLSALDNNSINGHAQPTAEVRGSVITIDANAGLAQFALESHLDSLLATAREQGVAVAAVRNTYTTGELGWYPRFFARHGFISLTTTNSPALVALSETGRRVIGTNPVAFGVPDAMVIDQAISPSAFHTVRQYAERGEELPEGWAVDGSGNPTRDARTAVEEGALLPFGGHRGGNLALMGEMLAMLAGGRSSLSAAEQGNGQPGVGLFSLVLNPGFFAEDALGRLGAQLETLREQHEVYIPGRGRPTPSEVEIDDATWQKLEDLM